MCANSHSMAASPSELPVASSAFWQRISGKPMPSSMPRAASLNAGSPGAAAASAEGRGRGDSSALGPRRQGLAGCANSPASSSGSGTSPSTRPVPFHCDRSTSAPNTSGTSVRRRAEEWKRGSASPSGRRARALQADAPSFCGTQLTSWNFLAWSARTSGKVVKRDCLQRRGKGRVSVVGLRGSV